MNRIEYLYKINNCASRFVLEVEGLNRSNLYDINIHAETFLIPILNEVFGLSLENLNSTTKRQFPAIDLADWTNKVAFQVTATCNLGKIKNTLKNFKDKSLNDFFDVLYIYIITHKKDKYKDVMLKTDIDIPNNFKFSISKNVIDKDDLIQKIAAITSTRKIEKIAEIYQDEFSETKIRMREKIFINSRSNTQIPSNEIDILSINQSISNLPPNSNFFGREKDLETVRRAINNDCKEWGILISGIGGIGKTALALSAAHKAMNNNLFKAYVFLTAKQNKLEPMGIVPEDADVTVSDDFINETARILGKQYLAQMDRKNKKEAFFKILKNLPTLIIYDNLETLEDEEQYIIARFLAGIPTNSKAILTSRRQGAEGGRHLSLSDLDWRAAKEIIDKETKMDNILIAKIRKYIRRWKELYSETFGSPLALKHILGLLRVKRSLTFDDAIHLLRSKKGLEDRIDFMFMEARKELTENDKIILSAISYFNSSVDVTALSHVTQLGAEIVKDAIDHTGKMCLLDLSVNDGRYEIHPLTKEFIQRELSEKSSANNIIGLGFARYWLSYLKKYGGNDSYKTYKYVENEWLNIDTAIKLLLKMSANKIPNQVVEVSTLLNEVADNLKQFLLYSGRWNERILLCEKCYDLMKVIGDNYSQGWRAYDVSFTSLSRGNLFDAKTWIDRAIEVWDFNQFHHEEAEATRMLGIISDRKGEYHYAADYYMKALRIWRALKDKKNTSIVLSDQGILFSKQGQYDKAERCYIEAIENTSSTSDKAYYFRLMGDLKFKRGDLDVAEEWYRKALSIGGRSKIQQVIAGAYYGLAKIEEEKGSILEAYKFANRSLKIREQLQHAELKSSFNLVQNLKERLCLIVPILVLYKFVNCHSLIF